MSNPDSAVGYGKPPKAHQFKKGKSGNPKGRPKGAKSLRTIVEAELSEKILVTIGGQRKKITKKEAIIAQMVTNALKGDAKSRSDVLKLIASVEPDEASESDRTLPPTETDIAVLRAALENLKQETQDEQH